MLPLAGNFQVFMIPDWQWDWRARSRITGPICNTPACVSGPKTVGMNGYSTDLDKVFTEGQCHVFALVLHRLTGWPLMAAIERTNDPNWIETGEVYHVFAMQPHTKQAVDVEGLQPLDNILRQYPQAGLVSINEAWILHELNSGKRLRRYDPTHYTTAMLLIKNQPLRFGLRV